MIFAFFHPLPSLPVGPPFCLTIPGFWDHSSSLSPYSTPRCAEGPSQCWLASSSRGTGGRGSVTRVGLLPRLPAPLAARVLQGHCLQFQRLGRQEVLRPHQKVQECPRARALVLDILCAVPRVQPFASQARNREKWLSSWLTQCSHLSPLLLCHWVSPHSSLANLQENQPSSLELFQNLIFSFSFPSLEPVRRHLPGFLEQCYQIKI